MTSHRTAAVLAGIFVIAGLLLLMWFSLELGADLPGRERVRAHAVFQEVQGLSTGNPVTLRGVAVGKVGEMNIDPETGRPRVTMLLDRRRGIRANAIARLVQPSLMGTRQIDLTYPETGPAAEPLEDGATLATQEQLDLAAALGELSEFGGDLRGLINRIDENQERAFGAFTSLIEENRPRVDRILTELDGAVPEARETLASVRGAADAIHAGEGAAARLIHDPALADDIQASAANLRVITGRLATAEGTLWRLIEEERLHADLEMTLASLSEAAEGMRALFGEGGALEAMGTLAADLEAAMPDLLVTLGNARDITRKINEGQGTIGLMVNDPALHGDLLAVLRHIREAFEKAEEGGLIRTFFGTLFGAFV